MAEQTAKIEYFVWQGKDKEGNKRSGTIEAPDSAKAKAELRRRGIIPTKVRKKPNSALDKLFNKPNAGDIAVFSRQLATMINSGVPLVNALDIIAGGVEKPLLREIITAIKNDVGGGTPLAVALGKYPEYFDDLFCNLINVGEQSGSLDILLKNIADYKERIESIKSKIKKAMFYPIAVISIAIIITVILMIFVVPAFAELFGSFGAELPAPTRVVIAMSEFLQQWGWVILGGVVATVWLFIRAYKKSPALRAAMSRLSLRLPVFGGIFTKGAMARFARTLSTMFGAGVPLVEAMSSVAGAVGNVVYAKAVLEMRDQVATGQPLHTAMQETELFPNMVIQMTAIGEEAGSLDSMLAKVADFFEEQVNDAIDALSSLMEPIIMAILGVLIGGLVVAMYMPIFQMGSVVGGT